MHSTILQHGNNLQYREVVSGRLKPMRAGGRIPTTKGTIMSELLDQGAAAIAAAIRAGIMQEKGA